VAALVVAVVVLSTRLHLALATMVGQEFQAAVVDIPL
jgi:hypothetical protein